jgi:predicted PurR-regulated permease PerM
MALPALLGMGALMGFVTRIIEWFVTRIAARFTNRLAGILVWTTLYISLLVGLAVTFSAIISGLSTSLPNELSQGIAAIKPNNFEACMSAIYGSKVAVWVFQQKRQLIDWEQGRPVL